MTRQESTLPLFPDNPLICDWFINSGLCGNVAENWVYLGFSHRTVAVCDDCLFEAQRYNHQNRPVHRIVYS